MIDHQFPVDVIGTERLISGPITIKGLKINNPSGMWLYIRETGEYVPANRLGFATNLSQISNTIHIDYVDGATLGGSASTVTGGPIVVSTSDVALDPSQGLSYIDATTTDIANVLAAVNNVKAAVNDVKTAVADVQTSVNNLTGGYGTTTDVKVSGTAVVADSNPHTILTHAVGKQTVIVRLVVAWEVQSLAPTSPGWLSVQVYFAGVTIAYIALSSQMPTVPLDIPAGGGIGPLNGDLTAVVIPQGENAGHHVDITMYYYLV